MHSPLGEAIGMHGQVGEATDRHRKEKNKEKGFRAALHVTEVQKKRKKKKGGKKKRKKKKEED